MQPLIGDAIASDEDAVIIAGPSYREALSSLPFEQLFFTGSIAAAPMFVAASALITARKATAGSAT